SSVCDHERKLLSAAEDREIETESPVISSNLPRTGAIGVHRVGPRAGPAADHPGRVRRGVKRILCRKIALSIKDAEPGGGAKLDTHGGRRGGESKALERVSE